MSTISPNRLNAHVSFLSNGSRSRHRAESQNQLSLSAVPIKSVEYNAVNEPFAAMGEADIEQSIEGAKNLYCLMQDAFLIPFPKDDSPLCHSR